MRRTSPWYSRKSVNRPKSVMKNVAIILRNKRMITEARNEPEARVKANELERVRKKSEKLKRAARQKILAETGSLAYVEAVGRREEAAA